MEGRRRPPKAAPRQKTLAYAAERRAAPEVNTQIRADARPRGSRVAPADSLRDGINDPAESEVNGERGAPV